MKTITLLLPDPTYEKIIAQARTEGFDAPHYLSSLVVEQVERHIQAVNQLVRKLERTHTPLATPSLSVKPTLPETVEQILAIAKYVWHDGVKYGDAVRKVAADLNVQETTVRDKCTRRISFPNEPVTTGSFLEMFSRREPLRDYLCRRFPKDAGEIQRRFDEIMR
jgi:hypothetical protein